MNKDVYNMLNRITIKLCGNDVPLEVIYSDTLIPRNQTACIVKPFLNESYIRLHELEIQHIDKALIKRGFDSRYIILEVLLHEIAHHKQYKKFIKRNKFLKNIRYIIDHVERKDYHERVADRYAHYCTKVIVNDIYSLIQTKNT